MKRVACWTFISAILWGSAGFSRSAPIFYVNTNSSGGNCSSWTQACKSLDTALSGASVAGSGQIWVAEGTYKPSIQYGGGYSGSQSNLVTFNLPQNTAIYGGFKGNESSLSQRNPQQNLTVLSGDLNGDDVNSPGNYTNKSDNAWHVLTADNGVANVVVDGFTVQDGYAGGPDAGAVSKQSFGSQINSITYAHTAGGGLIVRHGAQVSLNNIQFLYNYSDDTNATILALNDPIPLVAGGGAIAIMESQSSVSVNGSTLNYNAAINNGNSGGSIKTVVQGSVSITGSVISNSRADHVGGAIYARQGSNIIISGSNFNYNQVTGTINATESGGAIGAFNASISVSGSNFNYNSAAQSAGGGGAIFWHVPLDDGNAYKLAVTGSNFTENTASTLGGGAIFGLAAKPNAQTSSSISGSNFTSNSAGIGGAIFIDSIPMTLQSSNLSNNSAKVQGGAIFQGNFGAAIFNITNLAQRALLSISSSTFSNNSITAPQSAPLSVFAFNSLAEGIALGFGQQPANVDGIAAGGGALAVEFGGNVQVSGSIFSNNNASCSGIGGAILIGGNSGLAGTTTAGMNQAYLSIKSSIGSNNTPNNKAVLDPASLGSIPNGVEFVTDGSFN